MDASKLERTLGDTNLSIGTHLAMETLFWKDMKLYDESREFEKHDLSEYSLHLFNVFTLLRNVLNSIQFNDKIQLLMDYPTVSSYLYDEIETVKYLYTQYGFQAQIYFPDYTRVIKNFNVKKEYPSVVLWQLYQAMRGFIDKMFPDKEKNYGIIFTDYRLPKLETKKPFLLTTSFGVDLLNKGNFANLESHTGNLIKREHFGKKYHSIGKNDLSDLPMIGELYYILGDNGLVKPFDIKTRREVYNMSINNKWTYRTTGSKVSYDLNRNPLTKGILTGFNNLY